MAAGAWVFTDEGRTELSKGTWLDADTMKIALFLSTSNIGASSTTYAAATNEHANQSAPGYETGGKAVTLSRTGTTTVTFDTTDPAVWTATGGSILAKFGVLYEVSGRILAYFLLDSGGANVEATTGNTFTITIHGSGVFTLA